MSGNSSLLDNKETLLHFLNDCKDNKGSVEHRSNYFKTKGRHINLTVANKLKNSKHYENAIIEKTVHRLFYCSSLNLLKSDWLGNVKNVKSSNRCKNAHCAICRRARSGKLAARLKAAILDKENEELFNNHKFYFLTLTMKHDKDTRNYNYLKEFKEVSAKLRRSKLYKKHFKGAVTSIENVIGDQYHIHSHSLLIGALKGNVKDIKEQLVKKWNTLTSDSFILDLALIKAEGLHRSIMEVVKYSTKIMKLSELNGKRLDLLATWIIETKGQNFVNVSGIFRGLELTGNKSKYDTKIEPLQLEESDTVVLGKTSLQKFNFNTNRTYSKKGKEARDKYLYLKSVDETALIIDGGNGQVLMSELSNDFKENDLQLIKDSFEHLDSFVFDLSEDNKEIEAPF